MLLDVRPKPTLRASGVNLDREALMCPDGLKGGGVEVVRYAGKAEANDGGCNGYLVFSGSFTGSLLHLAWMGGGGGRALILRTMGRRDELSQDNRGDALLHAPAWTQRKKRRVKTRRPEFPRECSECGSEGMMNKHFGKSMRRRRTCRWLPLADRESRTHVKRVHHHRFSTPFVLVFQRGFFASRFMFWFPLTRQRFCPVLQEFLKA